MVLKLVIIGWLNIRYINSDCVDNYIIQSLQHSRFYLNFSHNQKTKESDMAKKKKALKKAVKATKAKVNSQQKKLKKLKKALKKAK